MNTLPLYLSSSIGRKLLMALSGLVWVGFVFAHMAGNMLIFVSAEAYNKYAYALTSRAELLYIAEAVLVAALLVHVVMAIWLARDNKAAKPIGYAMAAQGKKAGSVASRTMIYTGSIVLFFIVYHLITFKYGPVYFITYDGVEMRDIHRLVVEIFSNPLYVVGYVVCLVLLAMHLKHGVQAAFQSLGIRHPYWTPFIKLGAIAYAFVVGFGFISQPLYVFLMRN